MSEQILKEIIDELRRVRDDQNVMTQHISDMKETMATKKDVADIPLMKTELSSVKTHMSSMDGELSTVKTHMSSMDAELSSVKTHMSSMDAELSSVKTHMSSMDAEVSSVKTHMSSMDAELSSVKTDTSSMGMELTSLKTDMSSMKTATFEILDVVKHLELTQERQERTLDLLSRRSIDQEAEIKRIK